MNSFQKGEKGVFETVTTDNYYVEWSDVKIKHLKSDTSKGQNS